MSIKEKIKSDMITAMKAKEKERLDTIRFIQAAIKKQEIDTRVDLDDKAVTAILMNLAKQRRDSIDQFRKGGREDLVKKEEGELAILQSYLPEQMSTEELTKVVESAIKETGATGRKDMGVVMKAVMDKVGGKAEGSAISELVKSRLS
ncbi:MAG: GatB/YqeY domain-containing protein [Oligoflexia bacterium]|nr:GatB/YqeY domain-containing protein [Oligoflexia bacterium]